MRANRSPQGACYYCLALLLTIVAGVVASTGSLFTAAAVLLFVTASALVVALRGLRLLE